MSASVASRSPHLYLDTTVLLDLYYNRREESLELIELARTLDWTVSSSHFAIAELLDVVQERTWFIRELTERNQAVNTTIGGRHQRRLSEETLTGIENDVRRFISRRFRHITYNDIMGPGFFDNANGLCAATNMSAPDCLHVQMAIDVGADLMVTSDGQILAEAEPYVRVARPEDAKQRITDLGFEVS